MPSAAFIAAASAANRQPVVLLSIESANAIKRAITTQADWLAASAVNLNTYSEPGRVFMATDGSEAYYGILSAPVSISGLTSPEATLADPLPIYYANGVVYGISGDTPAFNVGDARTVGAVINMRVRTAMPINEGLDEYYVAVGTVSLDIYGCKDGGDWSVVKSIETNRLPEGDETGETGMGWYADVSVSLDDLERGEWQFKVAMTGFEYTTTYYDMWRQQPPKIKILSYIQNYETRYLATASLTTSPVDMGVVPTIASRFEADDIVPSGATITYHAYGSDTNDNWTDLGVVVDGGSLDPYRYYYFNAALTSGGVYTPAIDELRVIGGDTQYTYLSTHKDLPVQGALPYIAPGGISSISNKIDLTQQATVGELTAKLHWRKQIGDMVAGDYLKNKTIICKLGFVGLAEVDFEPYFVGTWHDYQSDQDKGLITVKTRNVLKRFTRKVPAADYFLDAAGKQYNPVKLYNLSGNIMDVMLQLADLLGIPDRLIDRASFTGLASGARSGSDWHVSRDLTEPQDARDMLNELAISAGVFLFEGADGKLVAKLYDQFAAADPVAVLDAVHCRFKPVDGGQKDLYTRQAIYYQLRPGADGGSTSDYAYCHLAVNAEAEVAWAETNTREWKDKWGLSVVAIQLLAQRWDSWFAVPRATVRVEDVPPRFYGIERGEVVAVNNLQLPCPEDQWQGYTSNTRFLVMGKSVSDPTGGNLTVSFDLMQLDAPVFNVDPDFPDYSRLDYWPTVQDFTLSERMVILPGGSIQTLLDVAFTQPTDFNLGGVQIWSRVNGGAWTFQMPVSFGGLNQQMVIPLVVTAPTTVDVALLSVNAAGRVMALSSAPQATHLVLGKTARPSDVTGFAASLTRGQVFLSWNPISDLDVLGYDVQIGDTWDAVGNVNLIKNYAGTSYGWAPNYSGTIDFLIKAIDTSGNKSLLATTTSVAVPIPSDVVFTSVTESLYSTNTPGEVKSKAVVLWSGGGSNVAGYDIEVWGPSDTTWVPKGRMTTPTYTIDDSKPGWWKIQVRAVNDYGITGDWLETQKTLLGKTAAPSNVTGFSATVIRGQLVMSWNKIPDLDWFAYEIQLGTVWDDAGNTSIVKNYSGTSFSWTPPTAGNINMLIKAIDTTGNYSTTASVLSYAVSAPGAVTNLIQKVIDNIVELHWDASVQGTFTVDHYKLYRGEVFATSELIGEKSGTFDLVTESIGGTFKYWVKAVDIAGLSSTEVGVYANVNQPPDYVLTSDLNLDLSACTLTNGLYENGQIILPVNTTITYSNHFQSNPDTTLEPWNTPQDQIDDGYTLYAQPGPATALIEKIVDYGAVLASTKISMSVTRANLAGLVTFTPEILISTDGSSYTSLGNVYEIFTTSFRYVKYRLAASTANGGMASVQLINVKLDVKQRRITTTMNVTDTASDGTAVTFASLGITPVDVIGIRADAPYTGNATNDPIQARVNFVDAPYPTSFKVLAWNKSGTRVAVNNVVVSIDYI